MSDEIFHSTGGKHDFVKTHQEDPTKLYPTQEDLVCELQLLTMGDWWPLDFKIHPGQWEKDKEQVKDYWRPFQPKEGIQNHRESILVYGLEGDTPTETTGLSHFREKHGYTPKESEFNVPTEAKDKITCLKHFFNYFEPFGRTFLISLHAGGFYPKHRDHWWLARDTIRLIGFLGDCSTGQIDWEVDDRKMTFMPNHIYYVNTAKIHRLSSWQHNSDMVVCNLPKNWTNVLKLMSVLKNSW